jgi:hypothetical protein
MQCLKTRIWILTVYAICTEKSHILVPCLVATQSSGGRTYSDLDYKNFPDQFLGMSLALTQHTSC